MKNLLITLAALVLLVGCKKKESILKLSDEVKRNFSFKPSSYWIYRDSISGRVDSFYLESVQFRLDSSYLYTISDKTICEKMTINIVQTSLSTPYSENSIWSLRILQHFGNEFKTSFEKNNIEIKTISANSFYLSKGIEKELKVQSNTFVDVHYFEEPNILFYIKEDIGYIKMRLNYDDGTTKINEVWELQRWHIIK